MLGWRAGLAGAAMGLGMLATPALCWAANCTTQAEMLAPDRDALAAVGQRLSAAVIGQDDAFLQSDLLPAEAADWNGIRDAVDSAAPLVKGGQVQLRALYVLDARSATATADTQFFCSNSSGSLTVTMTMPSLPPGRYAVVLADAVGAPLAGQIGLVLAWDAAASPAVWKLAGVSVRQGMIGGHDGIWYWERARQLVKDDMPWSAWASYAMARVLLVPVDFLSSPNLDRLVQEQSLIKKSPQDSLPYSIPDGERTWKIDAVSVDTSLRQADLDIAYEAAGVTDPAAQRTEAIAALSALLKVHPGLRANFHGLWAYAVRDGKRTAVLELPMDKIP